MKVWAANKEVVHLGAAPRNQSKKPHLDAGLAWLGSGGEMGLLISRFDWSRTPLGPLPQWPQSLRTAVSLMLNSRHPMWIGWGQDATFLYNDAYISVLSRAKHPGALGRPARVVWAEIWNICGPLADKVFQNGEASFVDDVQLFMNRGDFIEETYYSFSYSPIRDESGKVGGLFCPSTEVSAKVLNARRLATLSQLTANSLVEKSVEGACRSAFATLGKNRADIPFAALYLVDAPTRLRCAAAVGVAMGDPAVAPTLVDLAFAPPEMPWALGEVLQSARSIVGAVPANAAFPGGGAGQPVTQVMILPVISPGHERPLGVLIAAVNPARHLDPEYRTFYELIAGQIATAIQNARSVEDERRRAEQLTELDRAKTTFFSNISHELRTPLTLMLGPLEEIAGGANPGTGENRELAIVARRNGLRLLKLVNTLLDFSRLEAGRMQAAFSPVELGALTAELASTFRSAMSKAGLKFVVDCPALAEPAWVDRDLWEKIVLNLISNAYKFTLRGEVRVTLREEDGGIALTVSDTGIGIPESAQGRLFERFFRIEGATGRTQEGTGIGLALVHELVKLHGGSVRAESKLGEGSAFTVTLPRGSAHLPAERVISSRERAVSALGARPFIEEALRWNADDGAASAATAGVAPAVTPGRGRVLLVDDNADMRDYVRRLLSERFEVIPAPDGQAALEIMERVQPDLILSDIMMPRLDGFGLLRAVRSRSQWKTLPVILVSARAGEEAKVEGIDRGADDYLVKPFSARELIARVSTHLELARIRQEAGAKIREAEDRFRLAVEAADIGTWSWDIATNRLEWSDRAKAMIGVEETAAAEGLDAFLNRVHEQDRERAGAAIKRSLERGADFHSEFRLVRPDGRSVWISSRAKVFSDEANQPTRLLGAMIDITERQHREQKLRETRARLDATLNSAAIGTWTWDMQNNRLMGDASLFHLFSFPHPEEEIAPLDALLPSIHSDDLPRVQRSLERALRRETDSFEEDYRVRQSDGSYRWIASRGRYRVNTADGAPEMSGVLIDITERKKTEESLRQREELTSVIIDRSPVGTFLLDHELRVQHVNPCGQPVFAEFEAVKGLDYREITRQRHAPERAAEIIGIFEHTLTTGESFRQAAAESRRLPGPVRYYDWEIHRIPLANDTHGLVCYFVDVTPHVVAQRKLRESTERLEIALAAAKLGLWSWDAATDIVDLPDRAADIFGLERGPVITWRDMQRMLDPEDAPRARHAVETAVDSHADYSIEYRVTRPDGTRVHVAAMGRPLYASNGKASGMIGVVQDITARRQIEDERGALLQQEREAREEAEALGESARALTADLDLHKTVQRATDIATRLTGAKFGAFFYNLVNERQEVYQLFTLSGAPREAFTRFGMPRNTAVFGPTFRGESPVRLADVCADSRYGNNPPHHGMPKGHLPVRSYLAVPVVSRTGEVLGGMFFGHPEVGVFSARAERVAVGIAAQAAIAIDNAKLYQHVQTTADRLNFSLAALQLGDWRWDAESDLMVISARTADIYGLPPDVRETWEALRASIHPEDRAAAREAAMRACETATSYDAEYRIVHPKRGVRWVAAKGRPVFNSDRKMTGMMGVVQDITERKHAEFHLRSQKEVLEQIVSGATLQEILEALAQWVEHFAERKLIATILLMEPDGLHLRSAAGGSCPEAWARYVDGVQIGPAVGSCGTAAYRRESVLVSDIATDPLWTAFQAEALKHELRACWSTPILSSTGDVLGTFAIYYPEPTVPTEHERELVDVITRTASIAIQRKQAEDALRESRARLQEHAATLEATVQERTAKLRETIGELEAFSYSISHDMRAPLRAMHGYAEFVLKNCGPRLEPTHVQHLTRISQNAQRLELLVRDVLAYSKVTKEDVALTCVDLDTFVPALLGQLPESQRPDFTIKILHPLPAVMAHEAYLSQIFSNLVGNALKFARPDVAPEVQISATTEAGRVRVVVKDNGIGIEPEHFGRIFEIFGRVHPDKKYEGTGIGLSIVKKAVQRLGGTVGVDSSPGRGSSFWFTLTRA